MVSFFRVDSVHFARGGQKSKPVYRGTGTTKPSSLPAVGVLLPGLAGYLGCPRLQAVDGVHRGLVSLHEVTYRSVDEALARQHVLTFEDRGDHVDGEVPSGAVNLYLCVGDVCFDGLFERAGDRSFEVGGVS